MQAGRTPLAHVSLLRDSEPETSNQGNLFPTGCCAWSVWSGLVRHLDQPGGKPSNQNHIRGCYHRHLQGYTASQTRCGQCGSQATECLDFPLYLQENKNPRRYETTVIPARVGQDQTYPSFIKECEQPSFSQSESEWSNVAWILSRHHPHNGKMSHPQLSISKSVSYQSLRKSFLLKTHHGSVLAWQSGWCKNSRQAITLARIKDTHALQCWLINFHHRSFICTELQQIDTKLFLPPAVWKADLVTCETQTTSTTRGDERTKPFRHKKI